MEFVVGEAAQSALAPSHSCYVSKNHTCPECVEPLVFLKKKVVVECESCHCQSRGSTFSSCSMRLWLPQRSILLSLLTSGVRKWVCPSKKKKKREKKAWFHFIMAKMELLACFNWLLDLSLQLVASLQDDHYYASLFLTGHSCLSSLRVHLFKNIYCYRALRVFYNICVL